MSAGGSFRQAWLTETLRLREAHWGPLEDSAEVRRARSQGGSFPQRVVHRARLLGRREKLDQTLHNWAQIARWSLAAMVALALVTGFGMALAALGDGSRPVNLLLAVTAMLGLHALTFLLWLAGLGIRGNGGGAWLGRLWLDATRKLARGPDAALAPRALGGLLGRSGALRWSLGAVSHLLWLAALLSLLATLLALLSARRYAFNWETTLLSPDAFVALTQALGWLPARLGFAMPSEAVIRLSDGLHPLPQEALALWSSWLVGCVVVYGIIPRLIAFGASALLAWRKTRRAAVLDTSLPGYASLRPRLMPPSEGIAPDAPEGAETHAHVAALPAGTGFHDGPLIVGLELAPDTAWPPSGLGPETQNAGVVDSRAQRHALLDQLHVHPVPRLLVVCDGYQTPDRGILAYIAQLAAQSGETRVSFMDAPAGAQAQESRQQAWRTQLEAVGVEAGQVHSMLGPALAWLAGARHETLQP
ncbi:DUF2868 domain-containing protein [Pusillimonas noertemannii]|uniref:Uncharacterized protein DUF2868 n=1 Tax=Pusillimonas noertemannii TaxID=305977 RepID=A0A2U1CIS4_9BURK|nr:DUF2868 domain-containing protein [Pusillimonas noertemannii]NYT70735.1 DUF2868 domain-containing protein [Pusillimonas noertemannii]PVY60893.1 uncharacterized protein DUF2868 [Pusillimonas noertemannii]TFL08517.1 DUF2868 domain-containing protein [Pusillimonas noertemannii]